MLLLSKIGSYLRLSYIVTCFPRIKMAERMVQKKQSKEDDVLNLDTEDKIF